MNSQSSRSHAIFSLMVRGESPVTSDNPADIISREVKQSKINIVDLAGSERQSTAGTSGQRLREGMFDLFDSAQAYVFTNMLFCLPIVVYVYVYYLD